MLRQVKISSRTAYVQEQKQRTLYDKFFQTAVEIQWQACGVTERQKKEILKLLESQASVLFVFSLWEPEKKDRKGGARSD